MFPSVFLLFVCIGCVSAGIYANFGQLFNNVKECNPSGGKWSDQWRRCVCHNFYAGSKCQFVTKCLHGTLMNGQCLCDYGWRGDLCNEINCFYGQPTLNNTKCECHAGIAGMYCDFCRDRMRSKPPECRPNSNGFINAAQSRRPAGDNTGVRDELRSSYRWTFSYYLNILCVLVFVSYLLRKQKQRRAERSDLQRELTANTAAPNIPWQNPILPSYWTSEENRFYPLPQYDEVVGTTEGNEAKPELPPYSDLQSTAVPSNSEIHATVVCSQPSGLHV
jgi:hypothetical protein